MKYIRLILLPLTLIYVLIMIVRNILYDKGFLHQSSFSRPVICVGNITVGGTGKTPFIEFILRILGRHRPAIVSRGYHRQTRGLVVANSHSTVSSIGDEPSQIHRKHPDIPLAVCEDRSYAIRYLIQHTDSQVILMDDGYQHRETKASSYILIADYARPMWHDFTFPAGNMREPFCGARRASLIVVNKCPDNLSVAERQSIIRQFSSVSKAPVFFTAISYGDIIDSNGNVVSDFCCSSALALAGIGRPQPFFDEVARRVADVHTFSFPDHHNFTVADIDDIRLATDKGKRTIITTEKDATRLASSGLEFCYIPIQLKVLFNEEPLLETAILSMIK